MSLNDKGFLFVAFLLTQELCMSQCVNSPCHLLPLTNMQVRGVKFCQDQEKEKVALSFTHYLKLHKFSLASNKD